MKYHLFYMTLRERQALVEQYRKGADERMRLRAHIILQQPQNSTYKAFLKVYGD